MSSPTTPTSSGSGSGPVRYRAHAPGKVNLFLGVGPLRPDGYHDLDTVFHAVDLIEDVTVTGYPDRPTSTVELHVSGVDAEHVPTDDSNLAARALATMRQLGRRHTDWHCRIDITKRIPVAGGMAGGSADAAAALLASAALFNVDHDPTLLAVEASLLGADIPFSLLGGSALGLDRGDQLVSIATRNTFHWVFLPRSEGLSTPTVFRTLDTLRAADTLPTPTRADSEEGRKQVIAALTSGDPHNLAAAMHNDLEAAAFHLAPDLRDTCAQAREAGALCAMVSGSGPTVAVLCADEDSARAVHRTLQSGGHERAFLTRSSHIRPTARPVPSTPEKDSTPSS